MLKCDVLVVGASASGSVASLMLSKLGYSVLTIDKASRIGGFTNNKIDITDSELYGEVRLEPILKKLQIRPIKKINLSRWKSRNESFVLKSSSHDLYFKRGTASNSLDCQVMNRAISSGCEFLPNTQVIKFNLKGETINEVVIKTKGKRLSVFPKTVVGADGSYSTCRKLAQIKEKSQQLEGFGAMFKGESFEETQVMFDSELAPGGYIYAGSAGNEDFVCVIIDNQMTRKSSKDFFNLNKSSNEFLKAFEGKKFLNYFGGRGKYGFVENLTKWNMVLTGGAGLLVDPFLGYGLNYGIFSGYEASKAIDNRLTNDISLNNYESIYKEKFMSYFRKALKTRELFKRLNNVEIDSLVKLLRVIQEKKLTEFNLRNLLMILKYGNFETINSMRVFYNLLEIGM
ncbi:MAG: NAD(P)/FAD-dependent oxidoreductase [Candidatus Aenigmatarchaeota archaeon]